MNKNNIHIRLEKKEEYREVENLVREQILRRMMAEILQS